MKWVALLVMLMLPLSFARGQDEVYYADQSESLVVEDSFGNSFQLRFDDGSVAISADFGSGLLEFGVSGSVDAGFSGWAGSSLLAGDGIYRGGGKTAKNLTPSKKDLDGKEPGLSVTTTPTKDWKLPGKKEIEDLGFEVVPDPTDEDPNHHVIRPGKKLIEEGHTLREWVDGREGIDGSKPETWPELTKRLHKIGEPFTPSK